MATCTQERRAPYALKKLAQVDEKIVVCIEASVHKMDRLFVSVRENSTAFFSLISQAGLKNGWKSNGKNRILLYRARGVLAYIRGNSL